MLKDKKYKISLYKWRGWVTLSIPLLVGVFVIFYALKTSLPSARSPVLFYSTHNRDDLKLVLIHAIEKSQRSIHFRTYALTDLSILSLLKKKAEQGIDVHLYYHKNTSPKVHLLEGVHFYFYPFQGKGLMHEKLWIIDESQIFFSSANITYSSLKIHENSIIGVYSPELATALVQSQNREIVHTIQEQTIRYFSLPSREALDSLLKVLDQAKKRVDIFLFTFTHPHIVEKLIELHAKGIQIELTIDAATARGASKKAIVALSQAGIVVHISRGMQLFHHKWALIDNDTLIFGSANWTRAAFCQNKDFIFLLSPLKKNQIKHLNSIIKNINKQHDSSVSSFVDKIYPTIKRA